MDQRYCLIRQLGQGSMGQVFLTFDMRLQKYWAIKEITEQMGALFAEWDILKDLEHPGLPKVVDVLRDKDKYYLVMDYVEGENLKQLSEAGMRIRQKQLVEWGIELAQILVFLHNQKVPVLYRDMKPSNIIVQPDQKLKLVDFGIAIRMEEMSVYKKGWGTPGFAAKEQLQGQEDVRADIYSLGAVLLFLVKHCRGNVSRRFLHCIGKCMQQDVKKRYQTAKQLESALLDIRQHLQRNRHIRMLGMISLLSGCMIFEYCLYEIMKEKEEQVLFRQVESVLDSREKTVLEDLAVQLSEYSLAIDWESVSVLFENAKTEILEQDSSYKKAERILALANYYMSYSNELREGEIDAYQEADLLLQEGLKVAESCPGKTLSKAYEIEFLLGLARLRLLEESSQAEWYLKKAIKEAEVYIARVRSE